MAYKKAASISSKRLFAFEAERHDGVAAARLHTTCCSSTFLPPACSVAPLPYCFDSRSRYRPGPVAQLFGRAVVDDLAGAHHDDPVEAVQRRQAVRDGDHRAAHHQPVERFLDRFFRGAVQRRGGFVEQQDRRVLQDGARNRDALPLSARELDAAVADDRVVAFRHRFDEVRAARFPGGREHFFAARLRAAVRDVLVDGAVEQGDILRHDAQWRGAGCPA